MMTLPRKAVLSCGVAVGALAIATGAWAQQRAFDIPAQSATKAVPEFARQAGVQIISSGADLRGLQAAPVKGDFDVKIALAQLLDGTGLTYRGEGDTFIIERADAPQGGSAADGADGTVQALIVTAQKREENIQDVPIAMSAFTQEDLTRSQVAGGPDLMTQVPNMTFTKTNFSSYSIQIRGIGTQAISATTDPAVAVAFNNTPFVRNRFFEQEFYDLQRVEVLRGPQGTLYGRNATAGVVNLISAKPTFRFESKLSADVGNYKSTRLEGMINIPLVEDKVALRLAGAWTKRDGYATNEITGNPIDGRDLWSGRATLRFEPIDGISANLIYEHFEEDDDRIRSGKQVCKTDPGPAEVNGIPIPPGGGGVFNPSIYVTQGCLPASIYADESYQTPNGYALPFYGPIGNLDAFIKDQNPYAHTVQSRDLRVIESMVDPQYRAKTDVVQIQGSFDLTPKLTLTSETAYSADTLFSTQDYNRFNTKHGAWDPSQSDTGVYRKGILNDKGEFCDPQIGCSDQLVLMDLSTAESQHFSQEFRVSSDFDGPFNFSLGANFLRYDTEDKYYVFINSATQLAAVQYFPIGDSVPPPWVSGVTENLECQAPTIRIPDPTSVYNLGGGACIYVDPNPIDRLNDQGRNYFLSRNPYRLISYAAFGEVYYNATDNLKLTGGLRFTVDKKHAPEIPSWLLAGNAIGDYPVLEVIDQEWREPTGRLAIDWEPDLAFTDETLLYASYAHGYKAGGANPPPPVFSSYGGGGSALVDIQGKADTFAAEYVDAFEVGSKNTLLEGRLTLNLGAFYYDYQGYQISQIIDRAAINSNFDAKVWGAEIEADWRPLENLQLGFKGGYEMTRMADGSKAIDTMDRTAGTPGWMVFRPFPSVPSNCILPTYVFTYNGAALSAFCESAYGFGNDPVTGLPYVPDPTVGGIIDQYTGYPGFDPKTAPNGGKGFDKDLSGNELPNAPHFTATITADYTLPLAGSWLMTLHTDLYYQSEAWTRIFNTPGYDKLKAYNNINVAAIFTNEDAGWKVMAYVKNVLDRDSITGAFLNSDDTGLTTNVFLTEPRLYGLRVTKEWNGGSPLGGLFDGRRSHGPYPFQVEIGGGVNRTDAPNQVFAPGFVETYQPSLPFPLDVQDDHLGWSDHRDIKLTYAPQGGWRVSAAVRFGRTSEDGTKVERSYQFPDASRTKYGLPVPGLGDVRGKENFGVSEMRESAKHTIAEFVVGKDVGIGAWGEGGASAIGVGLRYAQFESTSAIKMEGTPDWYWPATFDIKYPVDHHSEYTASLNGDGSFEGLGPILSWDAAKSLFGDEESGRLDLDWNVTGGVLFGKQKTEVEGHRKGVYTFSYNTRTTLYDEPIDSRRNDDVTVPTLGGSLGLSYAIDWIKLGAGYRWERYFDAIDGGVETHKSFDRTIQGPYFKLSVGFGG